MTETDGTTFLSGANAEFIAGLYSRFLDDPASVDEGWRRFFEELGDDATALNAERAGPAWGHPPRPAPASAASETTAVRGSGGFQQEATDSIRALNLIRAYRVRGHLEADLDPLGIERRADHPELDYRTYGFSEGNLDREIFINNLLGRERATLREIVGLLREIYCGCIGVEYMHIQVLAERQWIQQRFEHREPRPTLTAAGRKDLLRVLT